MKKRLKTIFKSNTKSGKRRKIGLLLSVVALVEILALMLVSTSAWVESISSIKIYTTSENGSAGTKGVIESAMKQQVSLDKNSTSDINLTQYFRPSGDYHLAGASSSDGNTMYFPEIKGGSTSNYRLGSVNDKNVNYISFTVKTLTAATLAFDQAPTISFGGTPLSGDNLSLVRFSVGDSSGHFTIYSLAEETTEEVVATESGEKVSTTVYSFKDYIQGKDKVVTTTANGFLTFNMWIQDPTGAKSSVYNNKALTVSNLKLVTVNPFIAYAVTNNVIGNSGGNVAIEYDGTMTAYGATATVYVKTGTQLKLHAAPAASSGYELSGWATSETAAVNANSNQKNASGVYEYVYPATAGGSMYAKFSDEHTLYMKPGYTFYNGSYDMRYAAYVFGQVNGVTTSTWYSMEPVTYGTWNGYYKCSYKGSANNVIFCYMDPRLGHSANTWDNRWLQTFNLTVPTTVGEYGYVITSRSIEKAEGTTLNNDDSSQHTNNKLLGYWTHSYARVNANYCTGNSSSAGGSISAKLRYSTSSYSTVTWYNTGSTTTQSYVYVDGNAYQDIDDNGNLVANQKYDKQVTLTATPSGSYNFTGWYDNAAGTGTAVSTSTTLTVTAPDNGSTANYYAKFTAKPEATINIYVAPRNGWSNYYVRLFETSSGSNLYPSGTNGFKQATYDSATGYYKVTFTSSTTNQLTAIAASSTSYANQTSDLKFNAPSLGTTANKLIKNSDSNNIYDRGSYRCIWFIDGTSGNWIAGDCNYTDGNKTIMRARYSNTWYTMTRINNTAWIYEFSSLSTGSTIRFGQNYDNNQTYEKNYWDTTIQASKNQYTATGGAGHSTNGSGSWTN